MDFSYFLIPTDEKTVLTAEPGPPSSQENGSAPTKGLRKEEPRAHSSGLAAQPSLDFKRNVSVESLFNLSSSDDNKRNSNDDAMAHIEGTTLSGICLSLWTVSNHLACP